MGQHIYDFGSLTPGAGVPSGMTDRWTAGSWSVVEDQPTDSGHAIEAGGAGGNHKFLSLDDVGVVGDIDAFGKVRTTGSSGSSARCGFAFRAGGDESSKEGYQTILSGNDALRLNSYVGGTFNSLVHTGELGSWGSSWVYFHIQAEGDTIRVNVWTGTLADEPGTWQIVETNTDHSTGLIGLSYYNSELFYWDWMAIGTEGDPAPILETFTTDFSELPVDVQISGHDNYTTHWNTGANEQHYARSGLTGETGGRHIVQESTVDRRRGVAWEVVPTDATKVDVQLRAQYLAGSTVAGNTSPGIVIHGGGSGGSEDALRLGIQDSLQISQYLGGVSSTIATESITLPSDGEWFWLRFQVINGDTLRAKYWLDSESEPSEWSITNNDPGSLTSGWVGIWSFHAENSTPVWDQFIVSVNNDVDSGTADHNIEPNDLAVDVSITESSITETSGIQPNDLNVAVSITESGLVQDHQIAPDDLSVGVSVTASDVDVTSGIQPEDLAVTVTISSSSLQQLHQIAPNDLSVSVAVAGTSVTPESDVRAIYLINVVSQPDEFAFTTTPTELEFSSQTILEQEFSSTPSGLEFVTEAVDLVYSTQPPELQYASTPLEE